MSIKKFSKSKMFKKMRKSAKVVLAINAIALVIVGFVVATPIMVVVGGLMLITTLL